LPKVGPESAGAEPGPVCYSRGGTEPTVTDADLILGYLDPDFFLGGKMRLDREAALRAIEEKVARPLGLDTVEAAWGIHHVVNENMANAARVHAIERGKDPRAYPLFAFGGAGPVHAYRVARTLGVPGFIAPLGAGATSAFGFLCAPLSFDLVRSLYGRLDELDWSEVNGALEGLEAEGRDLLRASGVGDADIRVRCFCEMRYTGQGHEVTVELPDGKLGPDDTGRLTALYRKEYRRLYKRGGRMSPWRRSPGASKSSRPGQRYGSRARRTARVLPTERRRAPERSTCPRMEISERCRFTIVTGSSPARSSKARRSLKNGRRRSSSVLTAGPRSTRRGT
jgi:N-methylhydantoinase A